MFYPSFVYKKPGYSFYNMHGDMQTERHKVDFDFFSGLTMKYRDNVMQLLLVYVSTFCRL